MMLCLHNTIFGTRKKIFLGHLLYNCSAKFFVFNPQPFSLEDFNLESLIFLPVHGKKKETILHNSKEPISHF